MLLLAMGGIFYGDFGMIYALVGKTSCFIRLQM